MNFSKIFLKNCSVICGFFIISSLFLSVPVAAANKGGVGSLEESLGFSSCNVSSDNVKSDSLQACIKSVMQFALVIAGVVAVIQLAVAAFNYYNPEVKTDTLEDAIGHIRNTFIGLMLIAGPVMILNTFNTSLTDLRFLGFTASQGSGSTGSGGSDLSKNTGVTSGNEIGKTTFGTGSNAFELSSDPNSFSANATKIQDALASGAFSSDPQALNDAFAYATKSFLPSTASSEDNNSFASLFTAFQDAGLQPSLDPDLAAQFIAFGNLPDGSKTVTAAPSICKDTDCTISFVNVVNDQKSMVVTFKGSAPGSNPVNYTTALPESCKIPELFKDYITLSLNTSTNKCEAAYDKNKIFPSSLSASICANSSAQSVFCYKNPVSDSNVIITNR